MPTKIFLTGGTGYIGGTVLDTLASQHPEYEITVLLRNVPNKFVQRYPKVKIVKGDYNSSDVISDSASQSNIVVHNGNSDHEASIKAIISGLLKRSPPSFLLHLGGTGIVADWRDDSYFGSLNPKVWSDIDDLDAITSLPDKALHRNVDKIILEAAAKHGEKLKTAIICPPDIYGPGKGLARIQSVYFPELYKDAKKIGATFYAGSGTNTRSWVHIDDLMTVYLRLVEAAAAGGGNADWGKEGYYFAASQEASQYDISAAAGKIMKAQGLLNTAEPREVSKEQVDGMMSGYNFPGIARYMYGSNSRTRADRAKKVLGYEPSAPSIWETMEADILAAKKEGRL